VRRAGGSVRAADRVAHAFASLAIEERPEAWIAVRPRADVDADAGAVDRRVRDGESLPLAGRVFAVKDNIDVAGLPTTAGCPSYAYHPSSSAPAVERLVGAGAIVLGKTNLDQFATGLVGTRSPYGAVRSAGDAERISGGSSSGSAVAVALGTVDFALGTDTAGSGRVPAAFQGIVGIKPTLGLVPSLGVVPACRSYDTVSVLAGGLDLAEQVRDLLAGPHPDDPRSRSRPSDAPRPVAGRSVVSGQLSAAVPNAYALGPLSAAARAAFGVSAERLEASGCTLRTVDLGPFLDAARLLYGGALVAERYAAVGAFLETRPADADPVVSEIVLAAGSLRAADLVRDQERLDGYRLTARRLFAEVDVLLVPTTTDHPTLAEVAADPVGVNARLGTYTNFANLLDLCGVAVPAGEADGSFFGVTVLAPAFGDQMAAAVARRLVGDGGDDEGNLRPRRAAGRWSDFRAVPA